MSTTRKLHEKDICRVSDESLQDLCDRLLHGESLVLAVKDTRLASLIQYNDQATFSTHGLDFGDADFYAAYLGYTDKGLPHFPKSADQRFHHETNSYDSLIGIYSSVQTHVRLPSFFDMTRIVRPGGTLAIITGLLPEAPADHDAKWWIPKSDDAELESIYIQRHENFQTPYMVAEYTVTGERARNPEATVTTGSDIERVHGTSAYKNPRKQQSPSGAEITTSPTTLSSFTATTDSEPEFSTTVDDSHELNPNWQWSPAVLNHIQKQIEGLSLKICTGFEPLADVNLDITDLRDVAEHDEAEFSATTISDPSTVPDQISSTLQPDIDKRTIYAQLSSDTDRHGQYNGYACDGDAFDLPFKDNSFDTVISDPPWKALSLNQRQQIFKEVVRVTKPTGKILYNSPWLPTYDNTRRYHLRCRHEQNCNGNPSLICGYRRKARNLDELYETFDYDPQNGYPVHPNAIEPEYNTDPKLVTTGKKNRLYCCPMCGNSWVSQLRSDFHERNGEYATYECGNCRYRVDRNEVTELAEALEAEIDDPENTDLSTIDSIDYTPPCVEQELERIDHKFGVSNPPFSPELPWVSKDEYLDAVVTLPIDLPDNATVPAIKKTLKLIKNSAYVREYLDGDISRLRPRELQRRFETQYKVGNLKC